MSVATQEGTALAVEANKLPFKQAIEVIGRPRFTAMLPSHVSVDRFIKTLLVAVASDYNLNRISKQCPSAVIEAAMRAAELGLTVNSPLGEAYLIAFKDKVQMIPGYRGLISLARRSGEIKDIDAMVVYEGEDFVHVIGTGGAFRHVPNYDVDTGKPRFSYARATFKDGGEQVKVVRRSKIEKIKADALAKLKGTKYKSAAEQRAESPWVAHEMEMWCKTAVRALFKMLPVSTERIARALEYDAEASRERGEVADFDIDMPAGEDEGEGEREPVADTKGAADLKAKLKAEKTEAGATVAMTPAAREARVAKLCKEFGLNEKTLAAAAHSSCAKAIADLTPNDFDLLEDALGEAAKDAGREGNGK